MLLSPAPDGLHPHDLHPGLTADRLVAVASLLAGTLERAIRSHRPEDGEGNWSLGTRYCERRIAAIARAREDWPWLRVLDPSRRFVFAIDEFPMRTATGKGLRLRPSMRRIDADERKAHQLALFDPEQDDERFVWRFVVDVSEGWTTPQVTLVQAWADSGDAYRSWRIPNDPEQVRRWCDEKLAPAHDVQPLDLEWLDDEHSDLGETWGS